MNLQDQVIYFDRDGRVGYRFFTARFKRRERLREIKRRKSMIKKAKSPTSHQKVGQSTAEFISEIKKLDRILTHSEERFKLGNIIIETHKIMGERRFK